MRHPPRSVLLAVAGAQSCHGHDGSLGTGASVSAGFLASWCVQGRGIFDGQYTGNSAGCSDVRRLPEADAQHAVHTCVLAAAWHDGTPTSYGI